MITRSIKTKLFSLIIALALPLTGMAAPITPATIDTINPPNACANPYPNGQKLYDCYRYSLMYYYGVTVSNPLGNILIGKINRWPEHIQTAELAYTLHEDNWFRRLLSPLVGVTQTAGNFTYRVGSNQSNIAEFDLYLLFRWANLPWNNYVNTSLAIGEGVSYDSSYPSLEKKNNDNAKRFLNYLVLEATFAAPEYPRLQLVARIHHRSGAYGLYHAGNSGSNDLGLGIRYLFD